MKDFFKNKLNIVLTIVLVAVVALAIVLLVNVFGIGSNKAVTAIDFTGKTKTEVETWILENKIKDGVYSYSYDYSNDIEKDYVVYQSVKEGDKITDALVIVYSNGVDPNGEVELPSVQNGTTETEIESWFNQNEFTNVTYVYQTSDTHEFGNVISISPSKAKKSDAITVTVSLGGNIEDIETEVPNFSTYSKDEIIRWGNRYGITLKIDYETHDQAKVDEFVSQSVAAGTTIKGGDSLIVTLSSGQGDGSEATIPSTYLGISEADFIANLKDLGFTNLSKSSTTYYAESLEKDTIYSYDDGTFPTSKTISYALCAGKYTFDASELNGQTKTKAQSIVDSYKNRNARINKTLISISFENGDTNAEKAGEVYGCTINGASISCKVYSNGETASIPTDGRYLGKTEADYLAAMKELGYTNITKSSTTYYSTKLAKDTIYSYDDGEIALSKTINYALSAGAYSFSAEELNGITQAQAQTRVDDYKSRNARVNGTLISIKFTSGDSSGTSGNTYDCSISGAVISCKVYGGTNSNTNTNTGKTVTIPTDGRYLGYAKDNYLSAMKALGFSSFNESSTTYYSTTLGNGNIYSYDDGAISTSTTLNYALSCGKYTFNAANYNGLSKDAAQSKVNDEANRNARVSGSKISISFTNGDSSGTAGNTYDCSMNGSTISCKVYTSGSNENQNTNPSTEAKASIPSFSLIAQNYSKSSYDETVTALKANVFGKFSNVTYTPVTSAETPGTIISISVDGNTSYTKGEYSTTTPITVSIVQTQSN